VLLVGFSPRAGSKTQDLDLLQKFRFLLDILFSGIAVMVNAALQRNSSTRYEYNPFGNLCLDWAPRAYLLFELN
jgi:hypothetical protein